VNIEMVRLWTVDWSRILTLLAVHYSNHAPIFHSQIVSIVPRLLQEVSNLRYAAVIVAHIAIYSRSLEVFRR
jgi:hypothetical protein